MTSSVHLSTFWCLQTSLELDNLLSNSAKACSDAPETTISSGDAFRMLQDLTYILVIPWGSSDLCTDVCETAWSAGTAMQLSGRLQEQYYGRHVAVFSLQCVLYNHMSFRDLLFIFVTVRRFTTSSDGMHYVILSIYIYLVNLATDGCCS